MVHEHVRLEHVDTPFNQRAEHRRARVAQLSHARGFVLLEVRSVYQHVEQRRHQVQAGQLLALDDPQRLLGVPVGDCHEHAVQGQHRRERVHAHRVVERHDAQGPLTQHVAVLHDLPDRRRVLVALAPRHALGPAGGARRIQHQGNVRFLGLGCGRRGGLGPDHLFEAGHARRCISSDIQTTRARPETLSRGEHFGGSCLLEDHEPSLGIVHAVLDFGRSPAEVDGRIDRPQLLAGHMNGAVLLAVLDHLHHAIPMLNTKLA